MNAGSFTLTTLVAAGVLVVATWQVPLMQPPWFQGWVEASFILVGPDESGRVETLKVRGGDAVAAGELLFSIDTELQKSAVRQNEASLTNAQQAFNRVQDLVKTGSGTKRDYDVALSALAEIEARLSSARTRLARRNVFAPASGTIQRVYSRPGEIALPGRPVVSLLPPDNVKVRFFVPEALLRQIKPGDAVNVTCDGCAPNMTAHVSFISKQAEYTPPVLYSFEQRNKLVFLVEARPNQPGDMRVGQPVRVVPMKQGAKP
jgi:HlyD family secretion protein